MTSVVASLREALEIFVDLAPYLLAGLLAGGILAELLPAARVVRALGRPGIGSILKATLLGMPMPLCSCSVVPTARTLLDKGAGRAPVVAFLVSTPETGADSIALTYRIMGPVFAIVRPVAAALTAFAAGIVELVAERRAHRLGTARPPRPPAVSQGPGNGLRVKRILHRAFEDLLGDIAVPLIAGCLVSGAIIVFLPASTLKGWLSSNLLLHMAAMLVLGLPLFVCASASTPIAAAFLAKGVAPGAVLVFLLVGPATNLTTVLSIRRTLGLGTALRYVGTIVATSLLLGFALEGFRALGLKGLIAPALVAGTDGAHVISAIEWVAAAILFVLTGRILLHRIRPSRSGSSRASAPAPKLTESQRILRRS